MSASRAVPGFLPSSNGCHFGNSFHGPDLVVDLPAFGKVNVGDAANGVCGGMVFVARDFFEAHARMAADTQPPANGTPLFQYVTGRLIDSFDLPSGVLEYFTWMNTPDHDTKVWIADRRGIAWKTIVEQWPTVKSTIDSGHPCPLGLVTVYSHNPSDLGFNHVVCAYAYDLADDGDLIIRVYDPNSPNKDNVQLSLNVGNPSQTTPIAHNINISHPVRGFFAVPYSAHVPPAPAVAGP